MEQKKDWINENIPAEILNSIEDCIMVIREEGLSLLRLPELLAIAYEAKNWEEKNCNEKDWVIRKAGVKIGGVTIDYKSLCEGLRMQEKWGTCPVCLRYGAVLQVDHYLPKAIYPALTFHPYNLAGICMECNTYIGKGQKDPLDGEGGKRNLTEIYFPYLRAGEEEVQLLVERKGIDYLVELKPKDSSEVLAKKRIENLDVLFKLHKRWAIMARGYVEGLMEELMDEENDDIRKEVDKRVSQKRKAVVKRRDFLLQLASYEYMVENIEAVIDEHKRRNMEKEDMEKMREG